MHPDSNQAKSMNQKIPSVQSGASAHVKPYFVGDGAEQLPDNWHEIAVAKLGEIVDSNRAVRVFLDSCVKCGACTDKCHYFLGNGDPKNMPVARQDLIRGVYRKNFTVAGKYFPNLVGALELTEELLEDWATYYFQCSECRRCSVYCPFGIDTAEITMAGRLILEAVGLKQKYVHTVIDNVNRTGNNLGMPLAAIQDILESLEEDVFEETGEPVRFPLDDPNAELLLVVPSADLYAEPHVDGLIGCAKMFHQTGVHWTLSSVASEAANFALFQGDEKQMGVIAERVQQAANALDVKQVVVGECGHAWRVASNYWQDLLKDGDKTDARLVHCRHICEISHELLRTGRLKLDPSVHDEKVVTFHDSCNVARGSRMGRNPRDVYRIPRELLKASCNHFVDMARETICEQTLCCGGGGGLLTDELMEVRVSGASPRVNALEAVIENHGVTHMAAICAICKSQFRTVLPKFNLDMSMIVSLHQLLGDAVDLK